MAEFRFFTNFSVRGNCKLCKQRIETSALSVVGVCDARWDLDSQTISIEYDHRQVTPLQLKEQIAAEGHDTDEINASDTIYESLPLTCKYRLPPS